MNKAIGLALLVGGSILLWYGVNGSDSFTSSVSRAATGSPTDKTVLLLAGGAAAMIAGMVLAFRPLGRR